MKTSLNPSPTSSKKIVSMKLLVSGASASWNSLSSYLNSKVGKLKGWKMAFSLKILNFTAKPAIVFLKKPFFISVDYICTFLKAMIPIIDQQYECIIKRC